MDNSQTPLDYKSYFYDKFVMLFKDLVNTLANDLTVFETKNDVQKVRDLLPNLNYEKIIIKTASNIKLIEVMMFLNKHHFDDSTNMLALSDKYWSLMPSFNLNKIILSMDNLADKENLFEKINSLHICAVTYIKVVDQIQLSMSDNNTFNPFDQMSNTDENIDVDTLFAGVEVKNISAYELLMETIINQQNNGNMADCMKNLKEDDVNEAASKLQDVLNGETFQGNKNTAKILSDMLNNIKGRVINLKPNDDKLKGKQGVEQLLNIAQDVANQMMSTIKDSNVSVLDIWDATSHLAQNTVQSDALNIVDNLIRSNIQANMLPQEEPVVEIVNPEKKNRKNKNKKPKENTNI